MCHVFGRVSIVLLVVALVAAGSVVVADPLENQVLKFQQRPMHGVEIGGELYWGHNEWSTIYGEHEWNMYYYGPQVVPGIEWGTYMADDFADPFDTPVVHVRWWGSYMEDFTGEIGVQRFLLSFETDVPENVPGPNGHVFEFSRPGEPILNQVVEWVPDDGTALQRGSGTFHERHIPGGGTEALFEYNAELELPFWQDPDTVYWLKIVALVDPNVDGEIVWGWHNRDYTKEDVFASREPVVIPGEHVQGTILDPQSGLETPVWHFQDDAVQGELDGAFGMENPDTGRMEWLVGQNQEHPFARWPQHYISGLDGPYEAEMERFSKDLAFELFTVPEPHTIVLLAGALLVLPLLRRRKRT